MLSGVRVFDGQRFLEGPRDVVVEDGRVAAVLDSGVSGGGVLFPGFVDAHVHLALSGAGRVARGGVTSVLDLGAPLDVAFGVQVPLRVAWAGPMLTARGGYPTRSWGADGFGFEIDDASSARDAVAMLAGRGAAMVKVALEPAEPPALSFDLLRVVVDEAHARGLRVAAHALRASAVSAVSRSGVDVLAHTPVEPLGAEVIAELGARGVTVISTVRAFGAAAQARANLAALAEAGCRVAYGTDLGNGAIRPGVDVRELSILAESLGGEERALAAATSVAGELCGGAGVIEPGARADLVWVRDYAGVRDLSGAKRVWIGGAELA